MALQEHFLLAQSYQANCSSSAPAIKPKSVQDILAPISLGELIDKVTILQIKTQHLQGAALENVKKELNALETTLNNLQLNLIPLLSNTSKRSIKISGR